MIYAKTELERLPHNCFRCPYGQNGTVWKPHIGKHIRYSYACALTGKSMPSTKRNRFCPLLTDFETACEIERQTNDMD